MIPSLIILEHPLHLGRESGQNALSKGIRTEWDSNPRPSDYESRAQTTTPQCSHTIRVVKLKRNLSFHEATYHMFYAATRNYVCHVKAKLSVLSENMSSRPISVLKDGRSSGFCVDKVETSV